MGCPGEGQFLSTSRTSQVRKTENPQNQHRFREVDGGNRAVSWNKQKVQGQECLVMSLRLEKQAEAKP